MAAPGAGCQGGGKGIRRDWMSQQAFGEEQIEEAPNRVS